MNSRQKKKLKNRAGFFHYKDYKLRVKLLYHAMDVVMKSSVAYAFKSLMFEHFKGLLLRQAPKKICDRNLRYKPFLTNCVGASVGRFSDIAKPKVIPSMSMRMVGNKIHSFSIDRPMDNGDMLEIRVGTPPLKKPLESKYGAVKVPLEMLNRETSDYLSELAVASRIPDEDSFKNGYKPDELTPQLPKGPLDGHKSWAAMFPRKYPDVNWPPEGTTVETTISDDGDTQVDVIKREGEPDLTITHMGLNADEPDPVVLSESAAEELSRRLENTTCVVDLDNDEEPLVIVEGKGPDVQTPKGDINKLLKYRGHVVEDFIKGGSAIEYPSSTTIDLRKDEDISGPIHLGPIDLGPTDGELLEEHLLRSEDKKRRFAANACEASADD